MSRNPLFQENPIVWIICVVLIVGVYVMWVIWMHNVEQRPKDLKNELDDLKKVVESQQRSIDRLKQELDDLKRNR